MCYPSCAGDLLDTLPSCRLLSRLPSVSPLSLCLISAVCDIEPPSLGVQEKMQLTRGIWACQGVGELAESQEVPKMGTPHLQDGETAAQERLARGCKTGSGKHPQVPWTLTEIYFSYKRHQ